MCARAVCTQIYRARKIVVAISPRIATAVDWRVAAFVGLSIARICGTREIVVAIRVHKTAVIKRKMLARMSGRTTEVKGAYISIVAVGN